MIIEVVALQNGAPQNRHGGAVLGAAFAVYNKTRKGAKSGKTDRPDDMEFFKGITGLYFLLGVLGSALVLELIIPWRRDVKIDFARWARNASMTFYGIILLSLFPALATYGAAHAAEARGLGLFNLVEAPLWAQALATIVVFDLTAYCVHRALHKWYFLWRTHRTHHGDNHIDATTSLRFHPLEGLLRAIIDLPFVFVFGLPPEGILFYFAIHAVVNTMTHTNVALPPAIDRIVSRIFVTPHIHRLHHSAAPEYLDTNFGTTFSLWDQMFGTFSPADNLREDETFGIEGPEAITPDSFANLALDPLRKPADAAIPKPEASPGD